MKVCFSTLGCPGWRFADIVAAGKDTGMQGIEIRGLCEGLYAPRLTEFLPENRAQTLRTLREAGLEIPILTSGAVLCLNEEEALAESLAYMQLAAELKVPYVRVLAEPAPQPGTGDLSRAARAYRELCLKGAALSVTPLIETNGRLADSRTMLAFLREADAENMGVLWDIHHPYRYFGEAPHTTVSRLAGFIKHCHIKDSLLENGQTVYKMLGYGDVPIKAALAFLKKNNYPGFVSLEWAKRWNPGLEEPGMVFAHFGSYIKNLLVQLETPEPEPY